jgi:hypothetical protein
MVAEIWPSEIEVAEELPAEFIFSVHKLPSKKIIVYFFCIHTLIG